MNNEIAKVRTYLHNKEWILAKELLLKIHLNHKENTVILCKLGDCCMYLEEYDLAKQCYIRCINYDKYYYERQNPKHYLKLAYIYQIYYDPYCLSKNDSEQLYESQLLYQQVLEFINNKTKPVSSRITQLCYFNYAQLLTKLQQYNLAQNYYDKLIALDKPNPNHSYHFVHYYYAQLLFIINKTNNKEFIYYHFEKAINLNPNIIKYYYKYSNILSIYNDNIKSNEILSAAHKIEFERENEQQIQKQIKEHNEQQQQMQMQMQIQKQQKNNHKKNNKFKKIMHKNKNSNNNNKNRGIYAHSKISVISSSDNTHQIKSQTSTLGIDKIELFITMTHSNTHIAHKYINLSNGDLNRAINIYMEDIEKREKRKLDEKKNKWSNTNKNKNKKKHNKKRNKRRKKQLQQKQQQQQINQQPQVVKLKDEIKKDDTCTAPKRVLNNTYAANNNQLLPPIVFNDPSKIRRLYGIKILIFDISTLAYLHSFKARKKMSKENIYHTDTLYVLDMFGGRDRIERIKEFFENIQEIGIKMIIVSTSEKSLEIGEALRRVHLFNFFKNGGVIAGKEIITEIKPRKNIELDIYIAKKLIWIGNYIDKRRGIDASSVLLIDNKEYLENSEREICLTNIISHGFDFLLETDLREIEKKIGCKYGKHCKYQNDLLEYPLNKSLSEINYILYKDIKFEIINNSNKELCGNNGAAGAKSIEKYISDKCRNLSIKQRQCFFYFFKKFKLLQESQHLHQSWIVLNLCFELMNIETSDSDLCRSLAMALSEYQYFADAEFYFQKSLEIFPTNITSLKAYAYFLFMLERYDESSDIFEAALEINPISKKAILGYARSLSFLKEHEKAEKYFKKCIEYYAEWDLAHFRYGKFLYLLERYQEAITYLLNAVTIWSHSARSHLYLAQCYDKLGDVEEFEYYLNEALKLEPEHHEAINKWERHYCKTYNASYFRKKKFVKQAPKIRPNKYNWSNMKTAQYNCSNNEAYQNEFKRFWYVHVWFNNEKKKQEYLQRFINTQLNDIRLILFEKDISTILRSQVGITSNNDIKYILDAINNYITLNKQYKEWLKKNNIEKEYQLILQHNAIYTIQQMVQTFNNLNSVIKIFGKDNEITAKYIYKLIQREKHQHQHQHQSKYYK